MQFVAPKRDSRKFVSAYKSVDSNLDNTISNSDLVILFGANLLENSKAITKAKEVVYMHPVQIEQNGTYLKYEAGSEEGVVLLLLNALCKSASKETLDFIDELDIGYLSAECSLSEEEIEVLASKAVGISTSIVVADDIYNHESVENIARVLATIAKCSDIEIVALGADLNVDACSEDKLSEPEDLPSYDGVVIYSVASSSDGELLGSSQFAMAAKVSNGDLVTFTINSNEFSKPFKLDSSLKGTVAINSSDDLEILSSYRFKRIKINKVGSENE